MAFDYNFLESDFSQQRYSVRCLRNFIQLFFLLTHLFGIEEIVLLDCTLDSSNTKHEWLKVETLWYEKNSEEIYNFRLPSQMIPDLYKFISIPWKSVFKCAMLQNRKGETHRTHFNLLPCSKNANLSLVTIHEMFPFPVQCSLLERFIWPFVDWTVEVIQYIG